MKRPALMLVAGTALLLAGCASVPPEDALADAARWAARVQAPAPLLADHPDATALLQAERARLLAAPLTQTAALELALRSSPGVQALLADGWQLQARTAMAGSWPRLSFSFERVVAGPEVEITRTLAFGLTELLALPWRHAAAQQAVQAQRLQLAADLLARHHEVRQQWVRAVAAGQLVTYHGQVKEAAEASAELARRMQQVGNFSRLQRAREQAFLADATAQLARAMAMASSEREALVRLLGLTADEAAALQWPERLPDLPAAPRSADEVTRAALGERLDLQIAQARLQAATREEGLLLPAWFDLELAVHEDSSNTGDRARGTELTLALPMPDSATLKSQGASAATLAAASRLAQARIDAGSQLRERFVGYRSAHDLARHLRDELVPLRKTITDEMLLQYNGMLVGVFDLLADARSQVGAVIMAIEAERDFWIADAALEAAILGAPASAAPLSAGRAPAAAEAKGH